jgi:plastocyanin domain-containing protein
MNQRTAVSIVVIVAAIFGIGLLHPQLHSASPGSGIVQRVQAASVSSLTKSDSAVFVASAGNESLQTFTLGVSGFQYTPKEIRVKQGTKVRIEGDPNTLRGCMLVVNIEGYDISKPIRTGDNVIEFTADKVGTFPIYCNMGLGNGKLIVDAG